MRSLFTLKLIVFFVFSACSQINRESREHYYRRPLPQHGFISTGGHSEPPKRPIPAQSVKRGKLIFQKNCLSCHGEEGRGDGEQAKRDGFSPKNLVLLARRTPALKFYMKVSQAQGSMPGWKVSLSQKDIEDIENYIRSLAIK